ncbi:unnamed protein product [Prunus armeniaca]
MVRRDSNQESEPLTQEPRIPVTLGEYFPKVFFIREPTETVHMTTCYQVADEDVSEERSETHEEQKFLTQVEDSPSHFNIEEEVELLEAIRVALVKALMDLNIHPNRIREAEKLEPESQDRAICCVTCASITFTDEDLLLGSKPHNRPLFVSRYVREQKLSRLLVDGGSAVNIMPKSTMTKLGITIDELSSGGVKKILGDVKPFTEAESYFADAKFYMDEDMVSEVIHAEVHSTDKAIPRKDEQSKCLST